MLISLDVMAKLESSLPNLDDIMSEVEKFANSGGRYNDAPHIIDAQLPMLCR